MKDPRMLKLCHQLVHYACDVKAGERVLIELFGHQPEMVAALVNEVYAVGALVVSLLWRIALGVKKEVNHFSD